ncbi:MAG: MBL fold metallo-hydrolase, partial [Synergistaceae bacterium]|nr:MBL fold metallo-hydrolase [Synergistaceae bacterium]
ASFPNAEVYVSKPEYDYWVNEKKNESVISALKLYTVKQFAFGDEVVPGIKAIETTGHTPGHASFLVEADGEKLIVAGDIIHFPEIQLPHPEIAVRYDADPVKAVQSRRFLLDYAAWRDIPIAGMHITPPGIIRVMKSGEGYAKQ